MNTKTIKKLVGMTIVDGKIDDTIRKFVMSRLSRTCLRDYLYFFKMELQNRQVNVKLSDLPDEDGRKKFSEIFKDKELKFETDRTLGAGVHIEYGDNVLKLNVQSLIKRTINSLKESL